MSEIVRYALSLLVGGILGAVFVWSLWFTVRRIGRWRRPGVMMAGAYVIRAAASAAVFLPIARGWGWQAVVSALLGFILVRTLLVSLLKKREGARPERCEGRA